MAGLARAEVFDPCEVAVRPLAKGIPSTCFCPRLPPNRFERTERQLLLSSRLAIEPK